MAASPLRIRHATADDAGAVAGLAEELGQSFAFSRPSFDAHYPALLAAGRDCALVALATRRAAPFYHALGYEDSAAYLRKLLPGQG